MRTYITSKIATCVGENPYENACDMLESIWKKEDKEGYYRSLNRNKPKHSLEGDKKIIYEKLQEEEMKEIIKECDKVKNITEKVNIIETKDTTYDEYTEGLIKKHIKSKYSTKYGIKNEKNALEIYNEETGNECKQNTITMNKDIGGIILRGKIDSKKEGKIIEIKNRTKRLFINVRMYEMIQVQIYMYMYEVDSADLVEHYNGKIHICSIEKDDEFIEKIIKRLKEYDAVIEKIKKDEKYQEEYFKSENRNKFIFS